MALTAMNNEKENKNKIERVLNFYPIFFFGSEIAGQFYRYINFSYQLFSFSWRAHRAVHSYKYIKIAHRDRRADTTKRSKEQTNEMK